MYTRSRYKQCSPQETVSKIQKILNSTGIKVEEEWFQNKGGVDSCRVRIVNDGLKVFDIGTNGKGMTKDFARASAYAEFMERLQNKAMFREGLKYASPYMHSKISKDFFNRLKHLGILLNFLYFPDERLYSSIIYAPFLELISGETQDFPVGLFRAMCGSTGLCAGNIREEAICQGINEILERYVLWNLFDNQVIPKHFIPLENFAGHEIYYKLRSLEDEYFIFIHNWAPRFHGIPVIGMLLMRKEDGAYTYRLGADFNAITALERCFTEIFQGKDVLNLLLKHGSKEYKSTLEDYFQCRHNGTGVFPFTLTYTPTLFEESEFPHHDFKTYAEELSFYKDFLMKNGKKIYVRDNSFLGFPAYAIYIPTMSNPFAVNGINSHDDWDDWVKIRKDEYTYVEARYNLPHALQSENLPPISSHRIEEYFIRLNPWNSSSKNIFYYHLAEALRFIALKKWDRAANMISSLMNCLRERGSLDGSSVLQSYNKLYTLLLETEKNGIPEISSQSDHLILSLHHMLSKPWKILEGRQLPKCFNCSECAILSDCYFDKIIALEKKLQILQDQYYERGYMVK